MLVTVPRAGRRRVPYSLRFVAACAAACGCGLTNHSPRAVAYNGSIIFPLQQGDVLYPQEQASLDAAQRLDALLTRMRRAGRPVKVAMFTAGSDFGSRPELFGHPQQAAEALDELLYPETATQRSPLIVVMPAGVGARGVSAADQASVRTVPIDIRADADQVAAAAGLAVQALARRQGVVLPLTFGRAQATSARTAPAATAALLTSVLASVGVLAALRHRRRRTAEPGRPL